MGAPEFLILDGERKTLIPPGNYKLRFSHIETKEIFNKPKLYVWFTIATFGEHFGKLVPRYYGLRKIPSQRGKKPKFAVGWKSAFIHEYAALFGMPARPDRIAMAAFKRVEIIGRVRTVMINEKQRAKPSGIQYSVVDELLRLDDGVEIHPLPSPAPTAPPPPT